MHASCALHVRDCMHCSGTRSRRARAARGSAAARANHKRARRRSRAPPPPPGKYRAPTRVSGYHRPGPTMDQRQAACELPPRCAHPSNPVADQRQTRSIPRVPASTTLTLPTRTDHSRLRTPATSSTRSLRTTPRARTSPPPPPPPPRPPRRRDTPRGSASSRSRRRPPVAMERTRPRRRRPARPTTGPAPRRPSPRRPPCRSTRRT